MTVVLAVALALLCGVSIGLVFGVMLGWALFTAGDDEPDYSGGSVMPRTAAKVTQADVARVLRAVQQTGLKMAVQISPDGSIRLEPVDAKETSRIDSGTKWVP